MQIGLVQAVSLIKEFVLEWIARSHSDSNSTFQKWWCPYFAIIVPKIPELDNNG